MARRYEFLTVWLIAAVIYFVVRAPATPFNEHVLQAYALLHGHVWVEQAVWEHVVWNGHSYLLHPPLAAFVLLPFVAIWGPQLNQTIISVLLGALDVALAWHLLDTIGVSFSARVWLTAFFGLGTVLFYEATLGASWGFTSVVSVAPTFLALIEVFGRKRAWLVGLWAGIAALGRYDLALVIPVYFLMLSGGRRWLIPGALPAFLVYLLWSHARFGGWYDDGMWRWYSVERFGAARSNFGPFSIRWLPSNLYTALFMGPKMDLAFPFFHPQPMGQALLLTSPAFLLALNAPFRERQTVLMWLAVGASMAAAELVYANGFVQFGARYWIMAMPFLLVLMAEKEKESLDQMAKVLVVASIVLVGLGMWVVRTRGFG